MRLRVRQTLVIVGFCVALAVPMASAEEGMWLPYDLPMERVDSLRQEGLQLTASEIFNPEGVDVSDAVVQLTGATGSFVSGQGLIITNHHVAFGAVQRASTLGDNILRNGFYAASMAKEIPAMGYRAYVSLGQEDVTERMLEAVTDEMSSLERQQAIELRIKEIVDEAERGRDVRCNVAAMFDGLQYVLYTRFEIKDVRVVYVPPRSIGEFGGEIDNWMWPRHTGDFAFLRAYVGPDGSSALFDSANVPYQPKTFLPISSEGAGEGEFTMLIGFPGRTNRYLNASGLKNVVERIYPTRIELYEATLKILEEAGARDAEVALRTSSSVQSVSNRLKNARGKTEGFNRLDAVVLRQRQEAGLREFIMSTDALREQYYWVFAALDSLYEALSEYQRKDMLLDWLVWVSDYVGQAADLHKWAVEREKPDIERQSGYRDRDSVSFVTKVKRAQINLVPQVDQLLLIDVLQRLHGLPDEMKSAAVESLFAGMDQSGDVATLPEYVRDMYERSSLGDLEFRLKAMSYSRERLESLEDPIMQFAVSLRQELDARQNREKQFDGELGRLKPVYVGALREFSGSRLHPDANSTKRVNFGEVAGYSPRDAVTYHHQTYVTGVMEKESGVEPFIVPEELKTTYEVRDFGVYADSLAGDVPVCFLTTNDATGGNSGSPLLNGRGEIIGLDFDRNYETVVCDYVYDDEKGRSIIVDARYILFVIDKVYHLDGLLDELTIH